MFKRYLGFALALGGLISAVTLTIKMATPPPPAELVESPAKNPFTSSLSASGIIEAVNENVAVGTSVTGIIVEVHKDVGQRILKGEPLLRLDTQELCAEEQVKKAQYEAAQAKFNRIQDQLNRLKSVQDQRAVSLNDLKTKEFDLLVSTSERDEAWAELNWIQTKIQKMTLLAPQDGIIIQKRARVGESLVIDGRNPPFIIGDLSQMQVRADVDEQNASWLKTHTKAYAFPKNKPELAIPLTFVRIEPYIIPKKSLTGLGDERVDTRVLQVIYTLDPPKEFALYVGQQVDVFIEMESNE